MRLRADLIRPPVLRNHEADGHRHATWMELFTDLAFVAVVGQIGVALTTDYTWQGLAKSIPLFVAIWWGWVGNTYYLSRFDSDDLIHRLMAFVHIGLVVLLAVGVPGAMGGSFGLFAGAYAGLRVMLVLQYLLAGRFNPDARPLIRRYASGFTVSPLLWVVSIAVPPPLNYALWALGLAVDLSVPLQRKTKELLIKFPPSEHHVPERFGLFTIIVLGESILVAVAGAQAAKGVLDFWIVGGFGLLLAFSVWWIYFEGVKGADSRIPHSRRELKLYQLWLYSHLPLQFAIVVGAVGVKLAMKAKDGGSLDLVSGQIFVGSIVLAMVCFHALNFSTLTECLRKRVWPVVRAHWGITLASIPVGWWVADKSAIALVAGMSLMLAGHVLLTFRETRLETDPPRIA